MPDCLICTKHASPVGELLFEGVHALLVHYPTSPAETAVYQGHLMVEARRHVLSFGDLDAEEAAEIGQLLKRGAKLLTDRLSAEHTYVFTIGHLVPHLHIHIVPRYPGTPTEYWGGMKLTEWPDAPKLSAPGVAQLVASLG